MPVILIVLFFALLLFHPLLAFIALGLAIVLLYRGHTSSATRSTRREVSDDASI